MSHLDAAVNQQIQNACFKCNNPDTPTLFHDCKGMSAFCKRRLVFDAAFENLDPELKEHTLKDIARDALFASPEEPGEFFSRLSAPKTVGMYFTRDQEPTNIKIKVNETQELKWEKQFKFLGIWLTPDLKFSTHCKKIAGKANHVLSKVATITKEKFLTAKSIRKLANAFIIGQIIFSYPVLSFTTASELKCLDKVTDSAARLVVGASHSANGAACGILAGVKPLKLEIKQAVFKAACKARQLDDDCVLAKNLKKSAFPAKLKKGFPSFKRLWEEEGGAVTWGNTPMRGFAVPCQQFGENYLDVELNL